MKIVNKALAYVIRETVGGIELLVFDHAKFPEAGTQVPGGTVNPGENPQQTVLREVYEETGIQELTVSRVLGEFEYDAIDKDEQHHRRFYVLRVNASLADRWSHIVTHGEEDKGLEFKFYWLPINQAAHTLAAEQGQAIPLLLEKFQ